MKPNEKSVLSPQILSTYSVFFIASVLLHFQFYDKGNKVRNWFRIDVFFLLGFGIVHFQWPIMYGLSNILPESASRIWVNEYYVNYATWLSTIGGISWIYGFSILRNKRPLKKIVFSFKYNKLLNFTILLFLLFLFTAGKSFLTGGVYKGEGGTSSGAGISGYIQLLFSISIILLTTIIILHNKRKYQNNFFTWFFNFDKKFLVLYFTYVVLFFLIGDRGGPISLLLTTTILIGSIVRPLKLYTLLVGVFVGGLFLSLISLGRSESSGIEILSAGAEKFQYTSGYDNTLELANSVRTLYMAVSEVPERHDFFYGRLWTGNLLSPFPFTQSLYLDLTKTKTYELGSAVYITYLTFGNNPSSGEGTSLIADIYLNFGSLGVVFFMFLLGIFFKKADNNLHCLENIHWVIVAAILASFSVYFGRASLFLILRPIIWSFIIMSIFIKIRKVIK